MNWGLEPYVRLYKTKTAEWHALNWQAKAIHALLLKEADRSGLIQIRPTGPRRLRLLAGLISQPLEVVEAGIPDLLADGCLVETEDGYVFPNYVAAQEAKTEAAQRMRNMREKRRDLALRKRTEAAEQPVTPRNKVFGGGFEEPPDEPPEKGASVTHRNTPLRTVSSGYAGEQNVTHYSTVLVTKRETPKSRSLRRSNGAAVAAGKKSPPKPEKISSPATAAEPLPEPSGDFERSDAVDECGFELRACDIAADLLAALEERRAGKGITPGVRLYATGLDAEALEVGVPDAHALSWAMDHEHLSLLAALDEESPGLGLRWVVKPPPPERAPPKRWTLRQCLCWLSKAGLSGGADPAKLEAWWEEAGPVAPEHLIAAAENYLRDRKFREKDWPLAVFISERVWKNRVPVAALLAAEEARR